MGHVTERGRKDWERLTPEQRAAVERVREANKTPEATTARIRAADLDDEDDMKATPNATCSRSCPRYGPNGIGRGSAWRTCRHALA
jgi:hypothetical protein